MLVKDGSDLKRFIRSIINERLVTAPQERIVSEKDDDPLGLMGGDEGKDVEKPKKGTASVDAIVDKLNSIRSGKSFRDSLIKQRMQQFYDKLDEPERKALLQFLSGIAQVVTGEVPAEQIERTGDPENPPANVEIKPKASTQPVSLSVKPNVISKKKEEPKEPGAEDTSAPVPIAPKKKR